MKKKKILLFFATMLLSIGMAHADEPYNAVLVTVPDGSTTYALSEMPKISYETNGTSYTANLFVKGSTKAVATVDIQNGQTLKAQWGTITPNGINGETYDKLTSYQKNGKKFFTGGKLIIIGKDGKQYDATGKIIK